MLVASAISMLLVVGLLNISVSLSKEVLSDRNEHGLDNIMCVITRDLKHAKDIINKSDSVTLYTHNYLHEYEEGTPYKKMFKLVKVKYLIKEIANRKCLYRYQQLVNSKMNSNRLTKELVSADVDSLIIQLDDKDMSVSGHAVVILANKNQKMINKVMLR